MNHLRKGAAAAAAVLLAGCTFHRTDDEPAPAPQKVAFTGKVDPALAGDWVAGGGRNELVLGADGTLGLTMETPTPQGKVKSQKKGEWLANGDHLVLKYASADGTEQVISYAMTVEGKSMTLSTKVPKLATKYTRK